MKQQNLNHYRYRALGNIDAIKREKYLLKHTIDQQEQVLSDDWEKIKKPFRFTNMLMDVGGLLFSSKKKGWLPMIFSGYRFASSLISKVK